MSLSSLNIRILENCIDRALLLGEEALPSIGNTLWRVWTMFTRSAITPPEWTDLDEIWGTPSILFRAGPDRFWARSARKRERESLRKFCFILSGKQRTTLPISGQPNVTKFAHKAWSETRWILSEQICEYLPIRGLFSKTSNGRWLSSTTSDFRSRFLRNDYKPWKVMTGWRAYGMLTFIRTVEINSKSFMWPLQRVQGCTLQCAVSPDFTYLTIHQTICSPFQMPFCFFSLGGNEMHIEWEVVFCVCETGTKFVHRRYLYNMCDIKR